MFLKQFLSLNLLTYWNVTILKLIWRSEIELKVPLNWMLRWIARFHFPIIRCWCLRMLLMVLSQAWQLAWRSCGCLIQGLTGLHSREEWLKFWTVWSNSGQKNLDFPHIMMKFDDGSFIVVQVVEIVIFVHIITSLPFQPGSYRKICYVVQLVKMRHKSLGTGYMRTGVHEIPSITTTQNTLRENKCHCEGTVFLSKKIKKFRIHNFQWSNPTSSKTLPILI